MFYDVSEEVCYSLLSHLARSSHDAKIVSKEQFEKCVTIFPYFGNDDTDKPTDIDFKFKFAASQILCLTGLLPFITGDLVPSILRMLFKYSKNSNIDNDIKKFAFRMNFYSSKGYDFIRSKITTLPHPSSLSKWSANINSAPGMFEDSFMYLEKQYKEKIKLYYVVLCLMSLIYLIDAFEVNQKQMPNLK